MLPCNPEWVEGIIGNGIFLYHHIETFTNLRYIQLTSAGFDRVPMDYVNEHRITIHNARDVYSVPMAELAVAGVLQLFKDMTGFYENQKNHVWKKNRELRELAGKTIVIIGCGSVGTECAKRFKAFGCEVVGVDVIPRMDENYSCMVGLQMLDEQLSIADVIVLTLPLTDETRGLIDGKRLSLIKKDGFLVNIARGAVIDQTALEKWDGNAILDVFEDEPLDLASPLWEKDEYRITPHNSFVGENNNYRLSNVIMKNLKEVL